MLKRISKDTIITGEANYPIRNESGNFVKQHPASAHGASCKATSSFAKSMEGFRRKATRQPMEPGHSVTRAPSRMAPQAKPHPLREMDGGFSVKVHASARGRLLLSVRRSAGCYLQGYIAIVKIQMKHAVKAAHPKTVDI